MLTMLTVLVKGLTISFLLFIGMLGILWFIIWMIFVHDKPANHPRISEMERDYIISSISYGQDNKKRVWQINVVSLYYQSVCFVFQTSDFN